MEIKLKLVTLMLSLMFTGLSAGLCFTWSNAITPGIGKLDDLGFLKSFQAMNRSIVNISFLIVFFTPILLLFINAYLYRNASTVTFKAFFIAAILYVLGVGVVTVFKNVPLNEVLDKTVLENLSEVELKDLRVKFEQPWNRWHMQRTIASFTAFTLLIIGHIYSE